MKEFTSPFTINQCKLTDRVICSYEDSTGIDPILRFQQGGTTIYFTAEYIERDGYLIFSADITTANGFEAFGYYSAEIYDTISATVLQTCWLYVNDDYEMESTIVRSLGLAGFNTRYFSYVWTNGQLTQFDIKFYSTRAALLLAEAGTSDDFLGHYRVNIYYDVNYNPYEVRSVLIS